MCRREALGDPGDTTVRMVARAPFAEVLGNGTLSGLPLSWPNSAKSVEERRRDEGAIPTLTVLTVVVFIFSGVWGEP